MYRIFVRSWWKAVNGKLVPHLGRKTLLAKVDTYQQARDYCTVYNNNHNPGKLSRKAEFEQINR